MDLGTRSIRSAGLGSGSIELTLPASLRPLPGLPCRISLRDGHRPEIALVPDLSPARAAFARLAAALEQALGLAPEALPLGEFAVALQPVALPADLPRLAWTDGLALAAPHPTPPTRQPAACAAPATVRPSGTASPPVSRLASAPPLPGSSPAG